MKFMEWVGAAATAMRSEDWPTEITHQTVAFMATESMRPDKVASMLFVVGAGTARNADTEDGRKTWNGFQAKVKARPERDATVAAFGGARARTSALAFFECVCNCVRLRV